MTVQLTDGQSAFWQRFCDDTGHRGAPLDCDSFGGPDIADELLALVLSGRKRATCTHGRWVAREQIAMPRPGGVWIVTDGQGEPACVVRTQSVMIRPFRAATPHFAWREGEGTRLLHDWKKAHEAFFRREGREHGFVFRESDPCVFETFDVIWRG